MLAYIKKKQYLCRQNGNTMKQIFTLLVMSALLSASVVMDAYAQTRYVGGDISTLPLYEKDLSYYKDVNGAKINHFIT